MKMKILVGTLVVLIIINLATIGTFVYFRFLHHPPPPGFEGRFQGPPSFLRIDEPQRAKVMNMMESLRRETEDLNMNAFRLERRTFDLLQENPAPQDSVDQNLRELSAVRLEISRRVTRKFMEMKSFLTPEQQRMMFDEVSRGHHGPPGGPMPHRGMDGNDMPPPDGPPRE